MYWLPHLSPRLYQQDVCTPVEREQVGMKTSLTGLCPLLSPETGESFMCSQCHQEEDSPAPCQGEGLCTQWFL